VVEDLIKKTDTDASAGVPLVMLLLTLVLTGIVVFVVIKHHGRNF